MAIEQILNTVNDDALDNLWQALIPIFPGCIDTLGLNLRSIKYSGPTFSFGTYKVDYKSEHAEKPSGKQTTDKRFVISFRVDKYWKSYISLKAWHDTIHNSEFGGGSADFDNGVSVIRVPITIVTQDLNSAPTTTGWVFRGSFIEDISPTSLDYTSGNPITVDCTFRYITMMNLRPVR